jgi:predicted anti-sigma-YlaC factor YlaD
VTGRRERRSAVDRGCQLIQEVLVEVEGDTSRLPEGELRHLDSCASCRALADDERRLIELLSTTVPPADRTVEEIVMRSLRLHDRRLVSAMPVAASLALALVGVAAVGGVPGGSLLATVPVWSSRGWLAVAGAASDWMVALAATSRAAQASLPMLVHVASVVATAIGSATIVAATRRWRTLSPWRSRV